MSDLHDDVFRKRGRLTDDELIARGMCKTTAWTLMQQESASGAAARKRRQRLRQAGLGFRQFNGVVSVNHHDTLARCAKLLKDEQAAAGLSALVQRPALALTIGKLANRAETGDYAGSDTPAHGENALIGLLASLAQDDEALQLAARIANASAIRRRLIRLVVGGGPDSYRLTDSGSNPGVSGRE